MKTFNDIKKGDKLFTLSWDKKKIYVELITGVREYKYVVTFYTKDRFGNHDSFSVNKNYLDLRSWPEVNPYSFCNVEDCLKPLFEYV